MQGLVTTLDVETTAFKNADGVRKPSPFLFNNYLVSVGWKNANEFPYLCIQHNEEPPTKHARALIQNCLDQTTLMVGHNIKFDMLWLKACGFKYTRKLWCTMIYEFVKACGTAVDLDLNSCCERYGIDTKNDEATKLFNSGVGFEAMPWPVVETYGRQDITITEQLYLAQLKELTDGKI